MPNNKYDSDEDANLELAKKLKAGGKKLMSFLQDAGLKASEVLKEEGAKLAETTSKKSSEFAEAFAEKTQQFADKASQKISEFAKATEEKTGELAKVASQKTEEFAEASEKEFKHFAKVSSKATKAFLKSAAETTKDTALLLRPLKSREKFEISRLYDYLNKNEYKLAVAWLKQGKATVGIKKYNWSFLVSGKNHFPQIVSAQEFSDALNDKVKVAFLQERFGEFAERAWNAVPQYVAPSVIGLLELKQAVSLQLFSAEPLNIVIVGDTDSGKHEVLNSAKILSDGAVVNAGEGICISVNEARKVRPGALMRTKNMCIAGKLHLLKKDDELVLYRTLETGYVAYNTKSGRRRYDSQVSILAECNPRYGHFEKFEPEAIKKQLLLDPYLVARFHAAFFVRKVELERFADIAEKVISENRVIAKADDLEFIKNFARHARNVKVELPAHLADKIKGFAISLKERENNLPYKLTSQTIVGIIRMAKASARMELRSQIESKDLERVFSIFNKITNLGN